jgi:hypothetical protein
MIPASPQWTAALATGAKPVWSLTLTGYPRVFTSINPGLGVAAQFPWISKISAYKQQANDQDGGSSISAMSVTVLDYAHLITNDFPSIPSGFKGMTAVLQVGFRDLPLAYWMTIATLVVDKVSNSDDNTTYVFRLRDQSVILQQQVYQFGDDGYYTSSQHPKSVGPEAPLSILQDVLAQVQPVLPFNAPAVAEYEAGLLAGALLSFTLTRSETAKDFLEQEIMKIFGGYWFFNYAGQLTPFFFIPFVPPAVVFALDQSNLTAVPVADESDLVNEVDLTMDYTSSSFAAEDIEIWATSAGLYNLVNSTTIDSRGARLNFAAWSWARLLAHNYFLRYGSFNQTYDVTAMWTPSVLAGVAQQGVSPIQLELGDQGYLSGSGVPDRLTGTIGLPNRLVEVVGFSKDFEKGTVDVSLLDKSWLQALTPYQVAPDTAPDYASASPTERETYAYIGSAATGTFSTGAANQVIY